MAELFASTSGTDSDWIVKLIDVCPADATYNSATRQPMAEFHLMVNSEILRARFRDSLSDSKPVPANEALKYAIDLHSNDHVFRKKHRIGVQVQSTWFPVYDRNPQRFVPNIFKAAESDYQKTTQRVYHSSRLPSAILLPVNNNSRVPDDAPDSCYPPLKMQEKISAAKLDSYAGTYHTDNFPITITRKGDELSFDIRGEKADLFPVSESTFYSKENWEFTFAPDKDGKVRAVAIRDDSDREMIAYRAE